MFLVQHFSEMGERRKKKKNRGDKEGWCEEKQFNFFFSDGGMIDWLSE